MRRKFGRWIDLACLVLAVLIVGAVIWLWPTENHEDRCDALAERVNAAADSDDPALNAREMRRFEEEGCG